MIFCNKCGKSNPEDARYCSGCGSELSRTKTENKSYASNVTTPKPKKKIPTWKKVIIGILVFFFIAAIGASSGEGTDSETTTEAEATETTKAINENVKLLMDTTGYKESICKKIYKKLKDCGSLIFTGRIGNVEASVKAILAYLQNKLGFTVCEITRT